MANRTERSPALRQPLSRTRVLEAALAIADSSGLEALTMRRLGLELGVEAMSLYNHVRDKDDILDGILDLVLTEVDLSPRGKDWAEETRKCAISFHDAMVRHRWACGLILSPTDVHVLPTRIIYIESVLRRFRDAGFSAEAAYHGYHAIDSHILGFTLWALGHSLPADYPSDFLATYLADFPFDQYPYLLEHYQQHVAGLAEDGEREFEFGLDLILDGLERIRRPQPNRRPASARRKPTP
ncbi:MAG TPA: TetR/AcrR family transcriptional regulator C-terminal domain-containing protein [Acidimicrobiales bacterium]|jgi:AcrR family transcriptional regulator|nr:TetR/AcrR family transcriptional regulator C-terminal domain-containing protein [Acidimicrobiales bacterium]